MVRAANGILLRTANDSGRQSQGPNAARRTLFPIVSIGGSYWGSRGHAPDENIRLKDFEETILLVAHVIERFAGLP